MAKSGAERIAAYRARQREAGRKLAYIAPDAALVEPALDSAIAERDARIAELEAELSRYRNAIGAVPRITETDLHPVPLDKYCGPTALAAITGKDYNVVIRPAINRARKLHKSRGVAGLSANDFVATLRDLGCKVEEIPCADKGGSRFLGGGNRWTLHKWIDDLSPNDQAIYAIVITGHFVVCSAGSSSTPICAGGRRSLITRAAGPLSAGRGACLSRRKGDGAPRRV